MSYSATGDAVVLFVAHQTRWQKHRYLQLINIYKQISMLSVFNYFFLVDFGYFLIKKNTKIKLEKNTSKILIINKYLFIISLYIQWGLVDWLVGWLVGWLVFLSLSTLVGYLMPNPVIYIYIYIYIYNLSYQHTAIWSHITNHNNP